MATVYRALDLETGKSVAMKVPRPECLADPESRERFRREGEAATRLCHPNIVRALAQVETEEGPALVLELVEGETLRELLKREGPLSVDATLRLLREILQALEHAHAHGVVHRDVSPRNVLLDTSGRVQLTDFGIARTGLEQTLTRAHEVLGSVGYFSPEQAMGEPVGPQADLYSVGVLGYEMLTGEPPFSGDNAVQVALKHVHEQPSPLEERRPDVPVPVRDALMRALRKDPQERFASARDMLASLEPVDLDRTLTRPPGWLPPAGSTETRPLPTPPGILAGTAMAAAHGTRQAAASGFGQARRAGGKAGAVALAGLALGRWAGLAGWEGARRSWQQASPRALVWLQDALGPPSQRPRRARLLVSIVGAVLLAALLAGTVANRSSGSASLRQSEPLAPSQDSLSGEADSLQRHLERRRDMMEREQEVQREAQRQERAWTEEQAAEEPAPPQEGGEFAREERQRAEQAREEQKRAEELAREEQKPVQEQAREKQKRGKGGGGGPGGKGKKGRG